MSTLLTSRSLLVKATVSKMDYQIVKDQLKKVFTNTSTNVDNKTDVEKIDVTSEEDEVFYKSRNKKYRQQNSYRGSFKRNNQNFKNKNYNKKMNQLNNKGEISCGSKIHWEKKLSRCCRKI